MKTLIFATALSAMPAFQADIGLYNRPLLWENPISWQIPAQRGSGLSISSDILLEIQVAKDIQKKSGAAAAAAHLANTENLELIILRATFNKLAGQLLKAQADYEKVLASENKTAPRAMALSGYKNILEMRIAKGEKHLYAALIKCLKDEWLNEAALKLIPTIMGDPQVPSIVKKNISKEEPIMALRLGHYEKAAEFWAKPLEKSEFQWLSQTENRRGNFLKAAELREKLAETMAVGAAKNRELTMAWEILCKAGLYDEAEALAGRYEHIKKLADYHWRKGLAAFAAGRVKDSRLAFEAIITQNKIKNRQSGAKYYLARLLELEGKDNEAKKYYRQLASSSFGYYNILAQGRLAPILPKNDAESCLICLTSASNERDLNLSAAMVQLLSSGPSGEDMDSLGFYLWLSEKGFNDEDMLAAAQSLAGAEGPVLSGGKATAELNDQLKKYLKESNWLQVYKIILNNTKLAASPTASLKAKWLPLAATLAAKNGDYRLAVSLMSKIPKPGTQSFNRWGHPLVYSRDVCAAYRNYGLPPSLLLALIRTESAYQSNIISASNARGLMQLLPATADKIASVFSENENGSLDLLKPRKNIRYGSWYLAALIDGFGSEEMALAGYNGGPYNIKSMILAKEGMAVDIFIESLPFEETSNYVKRITESRYIYEMAYLGRAYLPDLSGPIKKPKASLPSF